MWTWLGCTGAWKTSRIFCPVSNLYWNDRTGGGRRRSELGRRRSSEYVDFDRLTHWSSIWLTLAESGSAVDWLIHRAVCGADVADEFVSVHFLFHLGSIIISTLHYVEPQWPYASRFEAVVTLQPSLLEAHLKCRRINNEKRPGRCWLDVSYSGLSLRRLFCFMSFVASSQNAAVSHNSTPNPDVKVS